MHSKCHKTPETQIRKCYLWSVIHPKIAFGSCASVYCHETNLIWNQVLPFTACASPSFCDPGLRGKQEIMNWLICRGRFRGGQRRGNGSEQSIWDYPDLMGEITWPMDRNPLSIRADFVTLMCDVILQEPFRGSTRERAQHATRWQYI